MFLSDIVLPGEGSSAGVESAFTNIECDRNMVSAFPPFDVLWCFFMLLGVLPLKRVLLASTFFRSPAVVKKQITDRFAHVRFAVVLKQATLAGGCVFWEISDADPLSDHSQFLFANNTAPSGPH